MPIMSEALGRVNSSTFSRKFITWMGLNLDHRCLEGHLLLVKFDYLLTRKNAIALTLEFLDYTGGEVPLMLAFSLSGMICDFGLLLDFLEGRSIDARDLFPRKSEARGAMSISEVRQLAVESREERGKHYIRGESALSPTMIKKGQVWMDTWTWNGQDWIPKEDAPACQKCSGTGKVFSDFQGREIDCDCVRG
jgi:hypothetical protein